MCVPRTFQLRARAHRIGFYNKSDNTYTHPPTNQSTHTHTHTRTRTRTHTHDLEPPTTPEPPPQLPPPHSSNPWVFHQPNPWTHLPAPANGKVECLLTGTPLHRATHASAHVDHHTTDDPPLVNGPAALAQPPSPALRARKRQRPPTVDPREPKRLQIDPCRPLKRDLASSAPADDVKRPRRK